MLVIRGALFLTAKNCSALLGCRSKHTLPDLPYDFGALEPVICREIMELHHQKHHNAYVTNLNAAEEQLQDAVAKKDVSKIIQLGNAIKFNGGGHINHSIFWKNLSPDRSDPSVDLQKALNRDFQSMENFKKEMKAAAVAVQGSGWAWLGYNKKTKLLQIAACPNQDPLEASTGLVPLLGIDVWEHAYYLQYKNLRPNYVDAVFDVVNWKDVSERLVKAQ
ncbi:superoxide dismutase [Mn], mitochondrial isoform X1 [Anopheles marshallii]|uniref:superoxide dismutase [Mn], mitochondrial isoform X1 n=1 Tax=Anopheles marshallii TaxID=1521116 RepID=UPI00237A5E22|nr:superoxide dismutase [Mn], mitochondrial isoform X1 [Anopheles marshallii]